MNDIPRRKEAQVRYRVLGGTDIEETLWVLTDLVRQGKIRAFGCSTFPPEDIVDAHHVAERRGLMRFWTEPGHFITLTTCIESLASA
jgi:aryl-alcohol dehydrogenase-like predicted oxidoreductase